IEVPRIHHTNGLEILAKVIGGDKGADPGGLPVNGVELDVGNVVILDVFRVGLKGILDVGRDAKAVKRVEEASVLTRVEEYDPSAGVIGPSAGGHWHDPDGLIYLIVDQLGPVLGIGRRKLLAATCRVEPGRLRIFAPPC